MTKINGLLAVVAVALGLAVLWQATGWFQNSTPAGLEQAAAGSAPPPAETPRREPPPDRAGLNGRDPFAPSQAGQKRQASRPRENKEQVKVLDPEKLKFEVQGVVVGDDRPYAIASLRSGGKDASFRVEVGSRLDAFRVESITAEGLWLIADDGKRYQYRLGHNKD
jgi:hypothetical protein